MIIRCFEDANDHTTYKFSLSIMVLFLIGYVFLPDNLFELRVKNTHVLKVTNFMINLKNTKLLSFYACCKPGLIILPTEN